MKNKTLRALMIAVILTATIALPACKDTDLEPQKKVTLTGIPSKYNNFRMKFSLFKLEFSTTPEAIGEADIKNGSATFVLVNESDGSPFTGTGAYLPAFTIIDAIGLTPAVVGGTSITPIFFLNMRESTTVPYSDFEVKEIL